MCQSFIPLPLNHRQPSTCIRFRENALPARCLVPLAEEVFVKLSMVIFQLAPHVSGRGQVVRLVEEDRHLHRNLAVLLDIPELILNT